MPTIDRLVFIPFLRNQATDFVQQTIDANTGATHHQRTFFEVCYDDPGKPLEDLGFALTTRVHIAGHGRAGRPYISNTSGVGQKEYMPFNVVCDRMIEKGLPKRYCGAISTDVCYSAIRSNANPSFADLVARYLTRQGYLMLHTIGYTGPMNAVHETMAGHKYQHRVVDVTKGGTESTIKTSDWAAWKHYTGLSGIPSHLNGLTSAYNNCPPF
jgi:hypothetical protein